MTYSPDTPQNFPPPNIAVNQIRTNFSEFATIFDNNHDPLNSSNQGKHTNVILENQTIDPVVNGNFADLFSKSVISNSGISQQLFSRIFQFLPELPNLATQLTFNSVDTVGPVFQTFIAGGYIVYFGQAEQVPGPGGVPLPVTLTPAPTEILCVIANSTTVTTGLFYQPVAVSIVSNSQFNVNPSLGNADIFNHIFPFIAIARQ